MVEYVEPTGTPAELESLGYDGTTWDRPWNLPRGQITTLERMPSAVLEAGAHGLVARGRAARPRAGEAPTLSPGRVTTRVAHARPTLAATV